MSYAIIDRETWKRKEYFEHYLSAVPCAYSMTVKLEITALLQKKVKLYPAMLWLLTTIVNRHEEFRMSLNELDELLIYANMEPCYTIFDKGTETFSNVWTSYSADYEIFLDRYKQDVINCGKTGKFFAKTNMPDNIFTVSMMPWASFEAFNINTPDYRYLKPIFTIGKFFGDGKKQYLPLAIQVHHAVCDGFHVCIFINELQEEINIF